ncbi:Pentatricopeptide repeat-containing protein At2g41720 (Protein EMBRYO DEFECTIVE 2654) [Durusdinium trenchii]|uniref:Pentatricopeptide repeat-containing protein At2g41720 (Protein EMBRYO DEFECTIVE 2654) n=1 Tax=Durusdinium trenchii TaxID=1381693 RepID=A0ABP0QLR5_9DINO
MLDAWRRLQPTRLLTPPWTRLHRRHNPVSPLPWFRDHDVHLNGQEAFVQALSSCELARAWQHQLFLADAMQREGYGRCLPGFHALMHSKHWEEAIGLLEVMKLQGFSPTSSTFSFVVRSCGRAGQWRWPLKLISHGTDVDGTEGTDKELCNAVAAACQQAGEWQWSVWVLEQFGQSASGPGLSDSSFKLAITACKEGRHWLRALQMLGSVEQTLAQSEFLLSSTLKACGARWQICLALVDSFDAFALPVVMTSLISACERARKWEAALLFLERMASPASTDPVALSSAMSACVQATEWQRAGLWLAHRPTNDQHLCLSRATLGRWMQWSGVFWPVPAKEETAGSWRCKSLMRLQIGILQMSWSLGPCCDLHPLGGPRCTS